MQRVFNSVYSKRNLSTFMYVDENIFVRKFVAAISFEKIEISFSESIAYESRISMVDTFQERTSEIGPHFDTTMPSNITGLAGDTVQLGCRVKNLGNKTVSLINF